MLSLAACGIILMVLQGLALQSQMVLAKFLQGLHLPYFRLTCGSCVLFGVIIAFVLATTQSEAVETWKRKWIHLRGILGVTSFGTSALAVQAGVPMGDVAALMSINVVIAALLGRLFLGEPLRFTHGVAVTCSVAGATLISEPRFLFGTDGDEDGRWIGYALAPSAGFFNACVFISSRRAAGVSPWWFALSAQFWSALVFLFMPLTPYMEDFSLDSLTSTPRLALLGWFVAIFVASAGRTLMLSAGAKWCPAAVSATVSNASSLVFGYIAQILLFGAMPKLLTVLGAALMLLSIVTMALAQGRTLETVVDPREVNMQAPAEPSSAVTAENDDETESLASFVAQEFSEYSIEQEQLRLRKTIGASVLPVAQTIGAVAIMPAAV